MSTLSGLLLFSGTLALSLPAAPVDEGVSSDGTSQRGEVTDSIRVASGSPKITTPFFDDRRATVAVETTIKNGSKQATEVFVETVLKDAEGNEVARSESGVAVAAGKQKSTDQWVNFKNFKTGTPENPYLYTAHTKVLLGSEIIDTCETPFAIRSTAYGVE